MPGRPETAPKLQREYSGRCQNLLCKVARHNYKTAAGCKDWPGRLQNYSEIGRDGAEIKRERYKHNHKNGAECQERPGRLQNCSEIRRDSAGMKQDRQA